MKYKRNILLFIITLLPILLSAKNGLFKIGNYPIIVLRGSPYEMGLTYGDYYNRELKQNINNLSLLKKNYLKKGFFLTKPFIKAKFNGRIKKLTKKIPEEYLKILKGISISSEINIKDIVFYNSFFHFVNPEFSTSYFIVKRRGQSIIGGDVHLCNNKIISILKPLIILFIPESGNKYFGFTILGLTSVFAGLNDNNIAVFSYSEKENYSQISGFFINYLLQFSSSVEDAKKIIEKYSDIINNLNIVVVSFNENKKILFQIKDGKKKNKKIGFQLNIFPVISKVTGEYAFKRKLIKRDIRLKDLISKGVYPEYMLSDQIDIYSGKKLLIDDVINNQDTVQSFLIGKNRILFSADLSFAPHRQKIVFSPNDFFSGEIIGKIYKSEKLTSNEKKITLFKTNLEKISSYKNRIKFLDELYSDKKTFEYYITKIKLLYEFKRYKKVLKSIKEMDSSFNLNDTILFYKYKALLELNRDKEAKQISDILTKNKVSNLWFKK